jgi:non-ribosomal peptide synthetase-like protein
VAISFRGSEITYEELDRRANRIAWWLFSRGLGRGSLVAILLERSSDTYACILGVLKAGAAYVPIDPEYPLNRIQYILADSKAKCLITRSENVPDGFQGIVLRIDAKSDGVEAQPSERIPEVQVGALPEDLCYVIYTSGSTGRPKGVEVEHRNAAHLIAAEGEIFRVVGEDRVCQAASLSFDLSVEEIWLAFRAGATLIPCPPELSHGGPDFSQFLNASGVTVLSTVPTLVSTLDDDVPTLRLLILGGEVCPEWLVERWWKPGRRVVNTYGPTESTVIATCIDLEPGKHVSIGRPAPGYSVYIIDESLHPVPQGGVGEICVGGPGVARGYVGLPDETAARFVSDPFAQGPDGRMYLTGDLGRYNEDGTIDFLGRADSQVKLRGFRIELSEIESALMRQEEIQAAACAIHESGSGMQLLVGYVVPRNGREVDERSLRSSLRDILPNYMIPTVIETVDNLPRLPSGKLDRSSLPTPRLREADKGAGAEPETETEARLAQMWSELFRPQAVTATDDFFLDLGGHSLLAARMVSQLRKDRTFAGVSIADVYENPTIRSLASKLDRDRSAAPAESPPVPVTRQSKRHGRPNLHVGATFAQALALYFPYAFGALEWVTPYLVLFMLMITGHPFLYSVAWALASAILVFPVLFLLALGAKWMVLGRIRPGRHRLWGGYYLRWWFVHSLVSALPLEYLEGTPLLPAAYRLFGSRIGNNVHLETNNIKAFDLVSIGNGSSIDEDASLLGCSVQQGELVIGPVTIGDGCFVGTRSVVQEWSTIEDGGRLEDLSLLPRGGRIPRGATWEGSPAAQADKPAPAMAPAPDIGRLKGAALPFIYALLALSLPLLVMVAILPGVAVLYSINFATEPWLYLAAIPLVGATFVVSVMTEFVLLKRALVGRVKPGVYPVHSGFYVRYWVVDVLHRLSLDLVAPIHATVYVAPWYRALGTKIGRSVELSTATSAVPDLLELGDGATVADEVSLGPPRTEAGWMTLAPTVFGRKAFAGNSAVIPAGTTLGDGTLCGVLSIPPSDEAASTKQNAAWLGSPPIELPRRQASARFPETMTYHPTKRKRMVRGFIESFRVTLPPAGFIAITTFVLGTTLFFWRGLGLVPALLLLPITYAAGCGAVALLGVGAKWAIMGRYRPFEKPLYSTFIWRLELVNALYEFLITPTALEPLQGTPFLPAYQRLMGAKVGRGVYQHTTGLLEWDLVEIGDGAALNEDCVMQTHLFEDRVLKASYLRVGSGCDVGAYSIVLYESEMEDGSQLDALSLLMKGERLPEGTSWAGLPARSRSEIEVVEVG